MEDQSNSLSIDNRKKEFGNQDIGISSKSLPHDAAQSFEGRSDGDIWNAFQYGHEGAFSFIYDQYFATLYNYGCQLTRDTGLVEDQLQDFFVTLRSRREKTTEVYCIKAYLLKSFRRKILRHLKKGKVLLFKEQLTEESFKITFRHDMQFMKTQFQQEQQKWIEQALNKLTPREREAVFYFYFENLDYKSIAQVMGLSSAKSARNLIYKALSCLKKNKHMLPAWLYYSLFLSL